MSKITYQIMSVPGIGYAVVRSTPSTKNAIAIVATKEEAKKILDQMVAKEILR